MSDRRQGSARGFAALLSTCAMLTSCGLGLRGGNVDGSDHDGLFPTLRGTLQLNKPTGDAAERRFRFEHTVELDLAATAGDFDLANSIDNTDYQVVHASLAFCPGFAIGPFHVHSQLGIGADRVKLSGNPQAVLDKTFLGPLVGGEVRVHMFDWLHSYARLSGQVLGDTGFSSHVEAGLAFVPSANAEVFVAFRRWQATYQSDDPNTLNLDADWEGVAVGLLLRL